MPFGELGLPGPQFSNVSEKTIFALHLWSLINHWCVSTVLGTLRRANQLTNSLAVGILRVGYVHDIIDQIEPFWLENWGKNCT
jgi:hypothetical protein